MNCSDKDFVDFIDVSMATILLTIIYVEMHWVEARAASHTGDGILSPIHIEGCQRAEVPEGAAKQWAIDPAVQRTSVPHFEPIIQ